MSTGVSVSIVVIGDEILSGDYDARIGRNAGAGVANFNWARSSSDKFIYAKLNPKSNIKTGCLIARKCFAL